MFERSNACTPGVQGATGPPSFVQLLYTESKVTVMDRFKGGVQIRIATVRKCHSLHIVCHRLVNIWELSKSHIPGVQVAMEPLSLVPFCTLSLIALYGAQISGAIQTRTVCVHKCRLLQIVRHGLVNMMEWSNDCATGVQGATGPPSLLQPAYSDLLQLEGVRLWGAVQIRTAGVRKCSSLQIVHHGPVNLLEWSNGHTPGVQGATALPSLV